VASHIDSFKLPIREIEARYSKSELAIVAWRSQEFAASMDSKISSPSQTASGGRKPKQGVPEGTPDKYFNDEGQVDLSKVTGREALNYFASQGIIFPVISKKG